MAALDLQRERGAVAVVDGRRSIAWQLAIADERDRDPGLRQIARKLVPHSAGCGVGKQRMTSSIVVSVPVITWRQVTRSPARAIGSVSRRTSMPSSASLRSTPMRDIRLTKRAFSAAGVSRTTRAKRCCQQLDRAVDRGSLVHVEQHRRTGRRWGIVLGEFRDGLSEIDRFGAPGERRRPTHP